MNSAFSLQHLNKYLCQLFLIRSYFSLMFYILHHTFAFRKIIDIFLSTENLIAQIAQTLQQYVSKNNRQTFSGLSVVLLVLLTLLCR